MTTATKQMVDSLGRTQEERADWDRIVEEVNEEARDNWDDPKWRADFAAELTESILLGFEFETLLDRFIEVERTDFNGRIFIREAGGLKAFWMARGGYIEASELTSETSELPRDMIGVHVYEFDDKLVNSFAESAQTLRDLAIRRMDSEVNRRVKTLLDAAIPDGSPYYHEAAGLSKPAVDNALRQAQDESRIGQIAIVGRATMTGQIADFEGFSEDSKSTIDREGVLGRYRGANVVTLRNYKDEDDKPFLPANEMWIIGRDAGKFGFFGGLKFKEFEELDNWYWHYLSRRDAAGIVHHPERARKFVDTSLNP